MKETKYYFIAASQEFLVTKEPLEEVLRERIHYYNKTKKKIDFWLVPDPTFLKSKNFKVLKPKFPEKCLAIVSTNKTFITWLKLRLNNVFMGEFFAPNKNIKNPLDYSL